MAVRRVDSLMPDNLRAGLVVGRIPDHNRVLRVHLHDLDVRAEDGTNDVHGFDEIRGGVDVRQVERLENVLFKFPALRRSIGGDEDGVRGTWQGCIAKGRLYQPRSYVVGRRMVYLSSWVLHPGSSLDS